MEWKALSEEEAAEVKLSGRARQASGPLDGLMAAVKAGSKVRVTLPEGTQIRHLRWRVSRAAKKAELKIKVGTLADGTGVLVELAEPPKKEQPRQEETTEQPETPETAPETGDVPNEWEETKEPHQKRRR